MIIERLIPGETKLYLSFNYNWQLVEKCRKFAEEVHWRNFYYDPLIPGYIFDIALLVKVKELFPLALLSDELKVVYEKMLEEKQKQENKKADILKLF
jgi:hypothetical protein